MRLSALRARLSAAGIEEAATEARLLFSAYTGLPITALVGCDPECDAPALLEAARRREGREPLGYILGEVPFYRATLRVTPACLIPRSDTERLVELAIGHLPRGAHFADLGTGSGAIAVTVLSERPDTTAVAIDISADALAVAVENAARLGVSDRMTAVCADMRAPLSHGPFDAILSNPPYIPASVVPTLSPEVGHEPSLALDGGQDGLSLYRAILGHREHLKKDGFFLLECGYDQEEAMAGLADAHGLTFLPYRDYGHRFRGCRLLPH